MTLQTGLNVHLIQWGGGGGGGGNELIILRISSSVCISAFS